MKKTIWIVFGVLITGTVWAQGADNAGETTLPAVKLRCTHYGQYGVMLKPFSVDLSTTDGFYGVGRPEAEEWENSPVRDSDMDIVVRYSESECEDDTSMYFSERGLQDLASGKIGSVDMVLFHSSPDIELKGARMECKVVK